MNAKKIAILSAIALGIVFGAETLIQDGSGGSLILSLSIWLAIPMGCIAVVAASEIVKGKWHKPFMPQMLAAHSMILFMGAAFLLLYTQLDIYSWIRDPAWLKDEGLNDPIWLHKNAFFIRNFVFIVISYLIARKFAKEALKGTDAARKWAVFYIFAFVVMQSMVGFEWIMSLERPWVSTLLGAWFFIESFQCGLAIGIIILFAWRAKFDANLRYVQKSTAGLMFAFTVMWAYFYFSQLIVIWYGNMPSEVNYLVTRIGMHTDTALIARLIFALCWVIPFFVLLGKKPKATPAITVAMALTILAGFTLERWLMVNPVVPVNWVLVAINYTVFGFVFMTIVKSKLLPAPIPPVPESIEAH